MSVLITMRVKIHDFEGTKKAATMLAKYAKKQGCHWAKVYRSDKDPNDVLWLMEWDDVIWHLSDAPIIE